MLRGRLMSMPFAKKVECTVASSPAVLATPNNSHILVARRSACFVQTPLLLSKPRSYGFAPPKLTRVPGKFKCQYCKNTWASNQTLVTEQGRRCYQGETCANCGTTVKPFWTGEFQGTVFDTVRHFKKDHKFKPARYKMRQ